MRVATEELRGSDWTAEGCPYIDYWLGYYQTRSAGDLEAALRRYAPGAESAVTSADYLPFVAERVRLAVRRWRATGNIEAPELPQPDSTPAVIETRFVAAQPLQSQTRTRMAAGFGHDVGDVRIYDRGDGLSRANETSARALTIGRTIVLGPDTYKQGEMFGDLLLAHEIAHTMQQSRTSAASSAPVIADELGADHIAATAVARMQGVDTARPSVGAPRGLALRRCNSFKADVQSQNAAAPDSTIVGDVVDAAKANGATNVAIKVHRSGNPSGLVLVKAASVEDIPDK